MTGPAPRESTPRTAAHGLPGETDVAAFAHMRRQAGRLPFVELARHAHVSTRNRHRCRSCFCCAAVSVLEDRRDRRVARRAAFDRLLKAEGLKP